MKIIRDFGFKSFACLILALSLQACAQKSAQQNSSQQQSNGNGAQSSANEPSNGATSTGQSFFFRGEIGGDHRVEMNLVRDGQNVTGSYSYANQPGSLTLKGSIDAQGNLTMQEFDAQGTETGLFKAKWKEADVDPSIELEGKWSKPNGRGETNFYLIEQHVELGQGVRIATKRIGENKKGKYKLDVEYPQVEGASDARYQKFNSEVADRITKEVNEWKRSENEEHAEESGSAGDENSTSEMAINYDIKLATPDVISVALTNYTFEAGAAHGMSSTEVLNYDLKSVRVLELADLFQPGSNYLERISRYCINDLKRQSKKSDPNDSLLTDESIEEGAAAKADNYGAWNLMRKGILVTFDPYQVGPYAAGRWQVIVPYSALREVIKQDGAAASFAQGSDR